MPTSKLISFKIAKKLACEKMGKPIKWAMYVEWTNSEQQHYKARLKEMDFLNSYKEVDVESLMKGVCGQLIKCTIWLL